MNRPVPRPVPDRSPGPVVDLGDVIALLRESLLLAEKLNGRAVVVDPGPGRANSTYMASIRGDLTRLATMATLAGAEANMVASARMRGHRDPRDGAPT